MCTFPSNCPGDKRCRIPDTSHRKNLWNISRPHFSKFRTWSVVRERSHIGEKTCRLLCFVVGKKCTNIPRGSLPSRTEEHIWSIYVSKDKLWCNNPGCLCNYGRGFEATSILLPRSFVCYSDLANGLWSALCSNSCAMLNLTIIWALISLRLECFLFVLWILN